jgi:hypothetical protein
MFILSGINSVNEILLLKKYLNFFKPVKIKRNLK